MNGGYRVGTTNIVDGSWHYITVVTAASSDVQNASLYVDGNEETYSAALSENIDTVTLNDVTIGFEEHQSQYFTGIIDEVAISSIVRSAAWIKAEFYSGDDDFVEWGESVSTEITQFIFMD